MKKIVSILVCFTATVAIYAQTNTIKQYVDTYRDIAINEMIRTGVPAAITLAQGIVESQAGQSDLVKNSNNHFGIKCKDEWTGPYVLHDDDRKNECFRVYGSAEESFKDHSDFLKNRPYYTDLFTLDPADYKAWARGLKKCGYATERDYPEMLIKMIEANDLQQYSVMALERIKNNTGPIYVSNNSNQPDSLPAAQTAVVVTAAKDDDADDNAGANNDNADIKPAIVRSSSFPVGVFTINDTRVIYAKAGTSLLAVANNYNIAYSMLLTYNELNKADILGRDMLIFLERKSKKGNKDYHIVATVETIEDIAQEEGVRLENLLQYNTKITKGMQPAAGTKIYLRAIPVSSQSTGKSSPSRHKGRIKSHKA